MSWFSNLFREIDSFLHTPKVQAAEATAESLLPAAIGIVQDINLIAPNKTLAELNAVATKYALPAIAALESGQTAGNVALNLGTEILQKNHAPAAATSLLNTVIQNAVFAVSTGAVPATPQVPVLTPQGAAPVS